MAELIINFIMCARWQFLSATHDGRGAVDMFCKLAHRCDMLYIKSTDSTCMLSANRMIVQTHFYKLYKGSPY